MRVAVGSGVRPEGGLGNPLTSLVMLCAGGIYSTLLLLWAFQKQQLVFSFLFLYLIARNLPQLHIYVVIFRPSLALYLLLKEMFI